MVSLENGRVLLLGGCTEDAALTLVECLVLPTDDWSANASVASHPFWHRLAPMHEARASSGACVLHGRVFAAGGEDSQHTILQSVEYFEAPKDDIGAGYWTVVQRMSEPRDTFSLLALENRLYAFGTYSP
ncbi:unnamed protein product [Dibothriocephalus latus]|uniref:Uncharacterized protein n=1 Tax=Dibothriocephalus latus TaxID=60516 RepID=A0A3P7N418_DIBLA|nr:unnamed protein product [Dibothriocephalus latus]